MYGYGTLPYYAYNSYNKLVDRVKTKEKILTHHNKLLNY